MIENGAERRRFLRVQRGLSVRYRFISLDPAFAIESDRYSGRTHNVSQGGVLLLGRLPDPHWEEHLLSHRLVVGISLELTKAELPVRAICRAAWLEPAEDDPEMKAFGLSFAEITREDQERILRYILDYQWVDDT
jgi:c-di-GMP-binding flagellar brake protein YcgR